jgi:hypothetical protein
MQNVLKNLFSIPFIIVIAASLMYCTKEAPLVPIEVPPAPQPTAISFKQDTIPVTLSVSTARKENVGTYKTTAVEAKYPDSTVRKNSLIIRVTGDSARAYSNTEILATYTDSAGVMFSNIIADTVNKVVITKLEKKKNGLIQGSFTIKVSNSTKTKTYLLKEGIISSTFPEY